MCERQKLADFRLGVLSLADKMNLSNLDTLIALSEVSNIVLELLKVEGMEDEDEVADEKHFTEHLALKLGNILSWEVYNPETVKLLRQWRDMREKSVGSELANEEKELIYKIIDAVDCEEIYLDWHEGYVPKEEAKEYIRTY